MILHLLGVFAVGVLTACLVYIANRALGGRLPSVVMPVAIGLAMLSFSVWLDYSWYNRTLAYLPKQVKVIDTFPTRTAFAPWTYVFPRTDRFAAVDTRKISRNPKVPGIVLTEVLLINRFGDETITLNRVVDCAKKQVGDVDPKVTFAPDGRPQNVKWEPVQSKSALVPTVCAEPAPEKAPEAAQTKPISTPKAVPESTK